MLFEILCAVFDFNTCCMLIVLQSDCHPTSANRQTTWYANYKCSLTNVFAFACALGSAFHEFEIPIHLRDDCSTCIHACKVRDNIRISQERP